MFHFDEINASPLDYQQLLQVIYFKGLKYEQVNLIVKYPYFSRFVGTKCATNSKDNIFSLIEASIIKPSCAIILPSNVNAMNLDVTFIDVS